MCVCAAAQKVRFDLNLPSARHCRVQVPDLKPDRDLRVVGPSRTWMGPVGLWLSCEALCLLAEGQTGQSARRDSLQLPLATSPRGAKFLLPVCQLNLELVGSCWLVMRNRDSKRASGFGTAYPHPGTKVDITGLQTFLPSAMEACMRNCVCRPSRAAACLSFLAQATQLA